MNKPIDRQSHWLSIRDWSGEDLRAILSLAHSLKKNPLGSRPLEGKTLAMIFYKASTRTRMSFEVGASQLGAHPLMVSASTSQLGRGEPIEDSARVMSRYVDGIMIRTFDHNDLERWAAFSSVPVINGLTDLYHPCQILADLMTIEEEFGAKLAWEDRKIAWIGDGNNMAHSWIEAAVALGFTLRLACPKGYDPHPGILGHAVSLGANVRVVRDPKEAVFGSDVVTTDVWASMGQEDEAETRIKAFRGFIVDDDLMALSAPNAIFLHCLPAHRGEEVSASVLEGPQSRVWDEAENRLHAQKAIMCRLMS